MNQPQQIKFQYTREEYVEARRLFLRMSRLVTPLSLALWGLAVAAELWSVLSSGATPTTLLLGLLLLFAGVMLGQLYLIRPGRLFDRTPWMQQPCLLEYSREGVTLEGEGMRVSVPWKDCASLWETPQWFFLLPLHRQPLHRQGGPGRCILIPKEGFAAPGGCTAFRELALEQLGEANHRCYAR